MIESLIQKGYTREQIEQSLEMERYDEAWAAYHLLGLPLNAVSVCIAASITVVVLLLIIFATGMNVLSLT